MPTAFSMMLAINCKQTEALDVKSPLLNYIRATYSEREAQDAADDCEMIQRLRAEIVPAHGPAQAPALKDTLYKYLRCLTAIESRFPVSKDAGAINLHFVWVDAFKPKVKIGQYNIHYEKAGVIFNLAALHSQQAIACDRMSADGLKTACAYFQEAAGLFSFLKETESSKTDTPKPQDITGEVAGLMEKLMMAQAQECVFNKAVIDKKSPSTCARLAKQTHTMYSDCDRNFQTPTLLSYFDKSWGAHIQHKTSLYDVETLYQAAKGFREKDMVSTEISVLMEAFKRVQVTKKVCKSSPPDFQNSVAKLQEAIQANLAKAEKDNSTIYLERVPSFLDVPAVEGAQLAKSVPPNPKMLDAAQDNLFSSMVPDACAKAISKYSDLVDSLAREQMNLIEGCTDECRLKLKEWELPEILDALDSKSSAALPEGLRRDLEDVESVGGVSHLKEILAEIGELRRSVDNDLFECSTALERDASEDTEARNKYGDKWRPPPAATVAKPYWDKISMYRSSLQKAGDSDQGVMQRLHDNEAKMGALSIDSARTRMPRLQAPMVSVGPDDPAIVVATLRRNLEAMQEMASERGAMEEALKDMKNKDNILPKLMATNSSNYDSLFAVELKKYDPIKADVASNVDAQRQLLSAVGQGVSQYRTAFDIEGWRAACDSAAVEMRETIKAFRELLDHLSEGLRFYIGTSDVVRRCLQESQDFCFTRSVQREEMKQDLEQQAKQQEADKLAAQMQSVNMHSQGASAPPAAYPAPPGMQPGPYGAPPQHAVHPNYGPNTATHGYYQQVPPPPHGQYPPPQYAQQPLQPPQQQYGYQAPPPPQYGGYQPAPPPPNHSPYGYYQSQ